VCEVNLNDGDKSQDAKDDVQLSGSLIKLT